MVNKQVIGEERVGRTWGREETPCLVAQELGGGALYRRENEPVGGHCLRGLSGATLSTKSIYMHSPRWGQAHPSTQRAPGGGQAISPSDGDSRAQFGHLCNLYSVGFYLQTPRLGRHIPGEIQDSLGSHPCPESNAGSALCGSPSLEAWWAAKLSLGGLAPAS